MSARAKAVKALHARGAHLVLCSTKKGSDPKGGFEKNYQLPENAPALDRVLAHKGHIGVLPASLACVVFDVDHGGQAAVDQLTRMLGQPLVTLASGTAGRFHAWYLTENAVEFRDGDWSLTGGPPKNGEIRAGGNIVMWHPDMLAKALANGAGPGDKIPARLSSVDIDRVRVATPGTGKGNGAAPATGAAEDWSPGSRNDTFNRLAFQAVANGDMERALAIKGRALESGLPENEVERSWTSIVKGAERKGTRTFIANARTAQGLSQALAAIGVDTRLNVRARRYEYMIRGQWLEADDERTAWVIQVIQARCSAKSATKDKETGQYTGLKYSPETFHHLRLALGNNARVDPLP